MKDKQIKPDATKASQKEGAVKFAKRKEEKESDQSDEDGVVIIERPSAGGGKSQDGEGRSFKLNVSEPIVSTKQKTALFDDDDDDDDDSSEDDKQEGSRAVSHHFNINEAFATKYQERKLKEDVNKAMASKAMFGLTGGDEDEEDESSDDEVAEELTPDVDQTIIDTIRMIREKDPRIYQKDFQPFKGVGNEDSSDEDIEKQDSKKKKPKEKQLTYKDMVREYALKKGPEFEAEEDDDEDTSAKANEDAANPSYHEAQERAKAEFKKALNGRNDESEDDDDEEDFSLKAKQEATPLPPVPKSVQKKIAASIKPDSKDDEFLWKYINDRAWMMNDGSRSNGSGPTTAPDNEEDLSADEEELEKAEEFEQRFNFRFEDSNATQIVTHARHVEGSVRRKEESSRKKQRDLKKERKEEEKKQKINELKRLKQLKRQMIEEELKKAFAKAGKGALVAFDPDDLDKDFDPDEWDAKMAKAFGDDYYAEEDEELRVRERDDEGQKPEQEGDEDQETQSNEGEDHGPEEEMDEDDPKLERIRKIAQERVDEELGDEDVIAQDGKFRYRRVPENDFGLTEEEILAASDADLNAFVSLKRLAPYVDKEWHASSKHRSRFRQRLKLKMKELESSSSSKRSSRAAAASSSSKKQKRVLDAFKEKSKKRKVEDAPGAEAAVKAGKVSESRLKSYGL